MLMRNSMHANLLSSTQVLQVMDANCAAECDAVGAFLCCTCAKFCRCSSDCLFCMTTPRHRHYFLLAVGNRLWH